MAKNKDRIIAVRNGVKGTFSKKSWDLLGKDKHGWAIVDEDSEFSGDGMPTTIKDFLKDGEKKDDAVNVKDKPDKKDNTGNDTPDKKDTDIPETKPKEPEITQESLEGLSFSELSELVKIIT